MICLKEKAIVFNAIALKFNYLRGFLICACAAARRAIGTLNGEHET
jgi:hypothetical protein